MTTAKMFILVLAIVLVELPTIHCQKEAADNTGYCSVYNGKICKAHISSRQVWFSGSDGSGGWVNEQITQNLFHEMIAELPPICRAAAEVSPGGHYNLQLLIHRILCRPNRNSSARMHSPIVC